MTLNLICNNGDSQKVKEEEPAILDHEVVRNPAGLFFLCAHKHLLVGEGINIVCTPVLSLKIDACQIQKADHELAYKEI